MQLLGSQTVMEQKMANFCKNEVRKTVKKEIKSGKAVAPDIIVMELWKNFKEVMVVFVFSTILESERMPKVDLGTSRRR